MLLWSWDNQESRWHAQPLMPGGEVSLAEEARLWAMHDEVVILFARPGVGINGTAVLPIHPIADRDEITIGTAIWCVSFDSVPERKVFRSTGPPLQCGRCYGPLSDGEATIQCPQCHAHYHDSEALPCWTYGPCARCRRPTGGAVWHPAPLHSSLRRPRHGHTPTAR